MVAVIDLVGLHLHRILIGCDIFLQFGKGSGQRIGVFNYFLHHFLHYCFVYLLDLLLLEFQQFLLDILAQLKQLNIVRFLKDICCDQCQHLPDVIVDLKKGVASVQIHQQIFEIQVQFVDGLLADFGETHVGEEVQHFQVGLDLLRGLTHELVGPDKLADFFDEVEQVLLSLVADGDQSRIPFDYLDVNEAVGDGFEGDQLDEISF